ncbi:hypothetical protein OHS59_17795 [Streptomyces sp. NBC_00414]|uniref:hypothetical protein n=1 Tax=Streptomyces sp. NBC_00414 TaxID=2975739 RepID=UPI002E1C0159
MNGNRSPGGEGGFVDSDMGEREGGSDRPDLGALLAAAVRGEEADAEAEKRALAAFRDARDEGAHGAARTRRRDDWRPAGERRRGWSPRATLVALAASVTLGGVAVAAIGSGAGERGEGGERDGNRPSSSAAADAGSGAGAGMPGPSGPGPTDGPSTAQDTEAHCRAYDSVKKRGKALDSVAWQRLIRAAGGEDEVAAYCEARLTGAKQKQNTKQQKQKKNNGKGAGEAEKTKKPEASKSAEPSNTPGGGTTKTPKAAKATKAAKNAKSAKSGSG